MSMEIKRQKPSMYHQDLDVEKEYIQDPERKQNCRRERRTNLHTWPRRSTSRSDGDPYN